MRHAEELASVKRTLIFSVVGLTALGLAICSAYAAEVGDPEKGRALYRACQACHSLAVGRHMTGPSLAKIWGKQAGTTKGFRRYSEPLLRSKLTWDDATLDEWLRDPAALIPGNRMTFQGIPDDGQRRDLIAFLRDLAKGGGAVAGEAMGRQQLLDLKSLDANNRVTAIRHCGDTYDVTVEAGRTFPFWEFNLRFKTDGSDLGPLPGRPVIIPASMRGDRAFIIFAAPAEISPFIEGKC